LLFQAKTTGEQFSTLAWQGQVNFRSNRRDIENHRHAASH